MANFFVVSRAKPKSGYASTGLKHLKTLAEFSKANGAVHAEVGMIQTGLNAGSLVALQFFEKMAGIEDIYDKLLTQPTYEELFNTGNLELTGRAIGRIHHRDSVSSDNPKYIVLTKFSSKTEMLTEAKQVMDIFLKNGALSCGYATFGAGDSAGARIMGVRYPSLDAIQTAYEAARSSDVYASALSDVELHFRNLVRLG